MVLCVVRCVCVLLVQERKKERKKKIKNQKNILKSEEVGWGSKGFDDDDDFKVLGLEVGQ